jgi:hypothetical protein
MTGRWQAIFDKALGVSVVLPVDDLREHVVGRPCWCGAFEVNGVTIHNSADRRELLEACAGIS